MAAPVFSYYCTVLLRMCRCLALLFTLNHDHSALRLEVGHVIVCVHVLYYLMYTCTYMYMCISMRLVEMPQTTLRVYTTVLVPWSTIDIHCTCVRVHVHACKSLHWTWTKSTMCWTLLFRKSKYGRCWQDHLEFQSQIIKVMYLYFCPHASYHAQYPIFEWVVLSWKPWFVTALVHQHWVKICGLHSDGCDSEQEWYCGFCVVKW